MARTITEPLRAAVASGPLLELGAGDARLSTHMESAGFDCLGLDLRYPPAPRGLKAVAGDALRLPFADQALGAVLAPNLLRQLEPDEWAILGAESRRVLDTKGCLVILEDHPEGRDPAETNYRECLALMAREIPGRGRSTLSQPEVVEALEAAMGSPVHSGEYENEEGFEHPTAPLDWLSARGWGSADEIGALRERILVDGISYGRYWCAVYAAGGGGVA